MAMVERGAERKIHIRLTQDMHKRLRIRCAELDVTIQDYVVRMLDQALTGEAGHEDSSRARPKERRR
jgi:plasmid stability protein